MSCGQPQELNWVGLLIDRGYQVSIYVAHSTLYINTKTVFRSCFSTSVVQVSALPSPRLPWAGKEMLSDRPSISGCSVRTASFETARLCGNA